MQTTLENSLPVVQLSAAQPPVAQPPVVQPSVVQISKVFGITLLAACITFVLFAVMHKLISSNEIARLVATDTPIIDIHYSPEEEITREKPKLKPMEKPEVKPESLPRLPQAEIELNLDPGLYAANFAEPSPHIDIKPSFDEGDGVARPIVRVEPKYPAMAARDGLEGWVRLGFSITSQGTVDNIQVLASEPKRVFDQAARRALSKWKYKPNIQAGKAQVQDGMMVMLDFTLDN